MRRVVIIVLEDNSIDVTTLSIGAVSTRALQLAAFGFIKWTHHLL